MISLQIETDIPTLNFFFAKIVTSMDKSYILQCLKYITLVIVIWYKIR